MLALLGYCSWSNLANAQPVCSTLEERTMQTVTERFSIAPAELRITAPSVIFQSDSPVLYMEVSGPVADGLILDTGVESVPVRDGSPIHLNPHVGQRVLLTLRTSGGSHLCVQEAHIRVVSRFGLQLEDGFQSSLSNVPGVSGNFKRNAGEPIRLAVGGKLLDRTAAFSVDGQPATVLARSCWEVILRDPHPRPGIRTVTSLGYSIRLPFVSVQLQFPQQDARKGGYIAIRVAGLDAVKSSDWASAIFLYNFSEDKLRLRSGRLVRGDPDWPELHVLELMRDNGGIYTAKCKADVLHPGQVNVVPQVGDKWLSPPRLLPRHPLYRFPR